MGLEDVGVTTLTFQDCDVIDNIIIRSTICHFLLLGNWYQASISNRFRHICIWI